MRPLTLEIAAFGSYPGAELIDFTVLAQRGLFVVTGDTGAGKTTIFDAMSFALFGEMPSKTASEIRSHHASPDRHTYARFTFEVDGHRYTIERSPEYERPKKVGTGTAKENASVSLTRLNPDGSTDSLGTKIKEVKEVLDSLIGLSADQFQKVVLLPQGDFTAFLVAGSDDRERLLMKLFGGAIYEAVIDALKVRATALSAAVGEVHSKAAERLAHAVTQTERLNEQLGLVAPDGYDQLTTNEVSAMLAQAATPLTKFAAAAKAATESATAASLAAQALADAAQRFVDARQHRLRLDELAAARADVEAAEQAARQSAAARGVVIAGDAMVAAADALQKVKSDRDAERAAVVALFAALQVEASTDSALSISEAVATEQARVAEQQAALQVLDGARSQQEVAERLLDELAADLSRTNADHAAAVLRAAELDSELMALTVPDVVALDVIATRAASNIERRVLLDTVGSQLATAIQLETDARTAHDELLRRFVATQAPRLAAELVAGEPCSVCGSTDHPLPAAHPEGDPVDFAQVDVASKQLAARSKTREAATADVERQRTELGDAANRSLDELAEIRRAADAELAAAQAVVVQHRALLDEHAAVAASASKLAIDQASLAASVEAARAQFGSASAALESASAQAGHIDAAALERAVPLLAQATAHAATLHDLFAAVSAAEALLRERTGVFDSALAASEFTDLDAARSVVIDAIAEQRQLAAAEQHRLDTTSVSAALGTLEQQGVPDTMPDTDAARAAEREAAAERDRFATANTTAINADRDARSALAEHEHIVASSAALIDQRNDAVRAHDVCKKGGSLHMPLQRWVLARELDRVTAAANVHLARMTASRYRLGRVTEVQNKAKAFGLDLEVLDANTGRPRSTTSLSGGEQFQASLALALGLADVVSHGGVGSGRRFEALFIDEGFGTLDDNALNQAIETLYQLQASGRMVGAITHVEAMKQRLHPGIVVRHLPDGAGSTLTVNP